MTVIALTQLLMSQYLSVSTEPAKTALLVPISLPIPHIQVTAAQPILVLTQAIQDIALTAAHMFP